MILAMEQRRCIWIGNSKMNRIFIFLYFFHVKKILNQWIPDYCRNIRKTIIESSIKYGMYPSGLLNVWIIITANIFSAYYVPGGSDSKESACNVGDLGSIPALGRTPGERHGNPLQYSCLENPMDRGAWQAMVHGVAKSWMWLTDLSSPAVGVCLALADTGTFNECYSFPYINEWKNDTLVPQPAFIH